MSEKIIDDIFDKNYWEGPDMVQITKVRRLSTTLGFKKKFVVEFGKALVGKI